jgi:hypothetical protein
MAGAAVLLLLAIAACESGGDRDGMVSAVQDPIFYDIPKPKGFEPVYKNSRATASGTTRVAQVQYTGSLDKLKAKEFYETHMPSAGFQPRHWSLDGGTFNLSFESEKELCEVKISSSGLKTMLDVALLPKPEGSVPREASPAEARGKNTGKARMTVDRAPPP